MEYSFKQLVDLANGMLKEAETGREFTMDYVVARFDSALDEYPHDPIIKSMAQVINKQAKRGQLITSQKELYDVYNHFAGLSSTSMIKEAVGDLITTIDVPVATTGNETAVSFRPTTPELNFKVEHNPLDNLFDKNLAAESYYDPTFAKLGKSALAEELDSIGVSPIDIKVFGGNDYAIIYDAVFKNKLGTAHVAIPVEVKGGITTPSVFFNKDKFVDLTSENLNAYIVNTASLEEVGRAEIKGGIRTSSSTLSPSFAFEEDAPSAIVLDKVIMPEALKDLASYKDALIESGTQFAPELIRTAKAICSRELSDMGLRSQVSLAETTDNCIICSAELDSSAGKVAIKLPIEVVNDRLQLPSLFYNDIDKDRVYDFSKSELTNYLTAAKPENGQILRYSNDFFNMSYTQLKDEMIAGVANKNYVRAEQALNRIADKFGAEQHLNALSDYSKYLAQASIKEIQPQNKCRLLLVKGSIEPRCGHYNVPISRVATDAKGNCELLDRKAKYENLADSTGAMMRVNKITLT